MLLSLPDLSAHAALVGSAIRDLRVAEISPDETEVVLSMEYHYDGAAGPIAELAPMVAQASESKVPDLFRGSGVTIARGQGVVSLKLKLQKGKNGAPAKLPTDQVIVQMLSYREHRLLVSASIPLAMSWGRVGPTPDAADEPDRTSESETLDPAPSLDLPGESASNKRRDTTESTNKKQPNVLDSKTADSLSTREGQTKNSPTSDFALSPPEPRPPARSPSFNRGGVRSNRSVRNAAALPPEGGTPYDAVYAERNGNEVSPAAPSDVPAKRSDDRSFFSRMGAGLGKAAAFVGLRKKRNQEFQSPTAARETHVTHPTTERGDSPRTMDPPPRSDAFPTVSASRQGAASRRRQPIARAAGLESQANPQTEASAPPLDGGSAAQDRFADAGASSNVSEVTSEILAPAEATIHTAGSFSAVAPDKLAPWQQRLTLGPGDVLNISLYGEPDTIRTNLFIGPDGRLSFLGAQDVVAAGLTVDELKAKMDAELVKQEFRRAPHTMIWPVAYRSKKYFMLGKIARGGVFTLEQPMTIVQAVARAGGVETGLTGGSVVDLADLSRSFLIRQGRRFPVDFERLFQAGDLSQNIALEPDDYFYFAANDFREIFVLGEVNNPGPVAFLPDISAVGAIAAGGGLTQRAWSRRILVVRGSLNQPETFVVNAASVLSAETPDFKLQPKDIVFVSHRPWIKAEELLDAAATSFVQAAVVMWTGVKVTPINR